MLESLTFFFWKNKTLKLDLSLRSLIFKTNWKLLGLTRSRLTWWVRVWKIIFWVPTRIGLDHFVMCWHKSCLFLCFLIQPMLMHVGAGIEVMHVYAPTDDNLMQSEWDVVYYVCQFLCEWSTNVGLVQMLTHVFFFQSVFLPSVW